MRLLHSSFLPVAFAAAASLAPRLHADTVYLKNGAWIDGRVRARNEKVLEIEIGKIGRMEIAIEDIHEIEKNSRTGEEYAQKELAELKRLGLVKDSKEPEEEKKDGEAESGEKTEPETTGAPRTPSGPRVRDGEDELPPIDPALKQRIEELVNDLERHKAQYRVRAERHLKAIGPPALPYLIPLAKSKSELTRVAVMRLFHEIGDESVVEACIAALTDSNEFVRDLAGKTLQRVTDEDFGYQPEASPRRRELAQEKWRKWWASEKDEIAKTRALANTAGELKK
jgi:hypothetical protein